jgi:hypothetical protein
MGVAVGIVDVKSYYIERRRHRRGFVDVWHSRRRAPVVRPDCGLSQTARWAARQKLKAMVDGGSWCALNWPYDANQPIRRPDRTSADRNSYEILAEASHTVDVQRRGYDRYAGDANVGRQSSRYNSTPGPKCGEFPELENQDTS